MRGNSTSPLKKSSRSGRGLLLCLTFLAKSMNRPTEVAVRSATPEIATLFMLALVNRRRWPCRLRCFRNNRRIRSRALCAENQREENGVSTGLCKMIWSTKMMRRAALKSGVVLRLHLKPQITMPQRQYHAKPSDGSSMHSLPTTVTACPKTRSQSTSKS